LRATAKPLRLTRTSTRSLVTGAQSIGTLLTRLRDGTRPVFPSPERPQTGQINSESKRHSRARRAKLLLLGQQAALTQLARIRATRLPAESERQSGGWTTPYREVQLSVPGQTRTQTDPRASAVRRPLGSCAVTAYRIYRRIVARISMGIAVRRFIPTEQMEKLIFLKSEL